VQWLKPVFSMRQQGVTCCAEQPSL